MLSRSRILLSAALLSAAAFAAPANATNYSITFGGGHGVQLPWMKAIKEFYIPEVDKRLAAAGAKDKVTWTEAFGGTLVKIGGEPDGVREGIVDMAMLYTIFAWKVTCSSGSRAGSNPLLISSSGSGKSTFAKGAAADARSAAGYDINN